MPISANVRRAALARTRSQWNDRASWWDDMAEANTHAPDREADLIRTAAALRLGPGVRVLDAGCGSGQWAVAFAELDCVVTAVDVSPEMIARAERHAAAHGVSITLREADLADLPHGDDAFDAIHARTSLQFAVDLPATLAEMRRVLRPGGRLHASVPGALSPIYANRWRRLLEPGEPQSNWAVPWELEQVLAELGWSVVDSWGEFGRALDGMTNPLKPILAQVVADAGPLARRLEQAAATTWTLIAE